MENKGIIKLPDGELRVMMAVWKIGGDNSECITAAKVRDDSAELRKMEITTVLTILSRLRDKGFLTSRRCGKNNYYTILISYEEYRVFVLEEMFRSVYLCDAETFIEDIKAMLCKTHG